ncbi:MAG: RHS repeat-associated core domain-containing protein, partial [Limisphaerales bacterium]
MIYPDQQLAAKYLYNPFGNMLAMSGPLRNFNKYRFSSKEWEGNAGLYYYGYRFYDPNLQRWLNRDPNDELGFKRLHLAARRVSGTLTQGGVINDLVLVNSAALSENSNPFGFVGNDPLGAADWQGLYWGYIPSTWSEWENWFEAWVPYSWEGLDDADLVKNTLDAGLDMYNFGPNVCQFDNWMHTNQNLNDLPPKFNAN